MCEKIPSGRPLADLQVDFRSSSWEGWEDQVRVEGEDREMPREANCREARLRCGCAVASFQWTGTIINYRNQSLGAGEAFRRIAMT